MEARFHRRINKKVIVTFYITTEFRFFFNRAHESENYEKKVSCWIKMCNYLYLIVCYLFNPVVETSFIHTATQQSMQMWPLMVKYTVCKKKKTYPNSNSYKYYCFQLLLMMSLLLFTLCQSTRLLNLNFKCFKKYKVYNKAKTAQLRLT